ncbi:MAG TPA: urate hydroxylase PuuD, partial [Pyrinomonadaceae bacterium]|nr:urate hydroxylase PuuD [Pyrinomonadaceae bacterium]
KRKVPDLVSRTLHWFRWEAGTTWLSGFALLVVVYYLGGGALVDRDVSQISVAAAVALGVGVIVVSGAVYDLMMLSPLGRNEKLFAVVAYVLIVALVYALTNVFSGRAAYIHLGAVFGTIMAANVWLHILPAQRRMIAALNEGREPDARLAARAKLRSKQNTFMAVPVVFIMISNHYPGVTYGEHYNWLILSLLVLVGWAAAKFIRRA